MNLPDYLKHLGDLFPECHGCEECNYCRMSKLLTSVWDSGRRSGASTSAEKKQKAFTWKEWEWLPAHREDLISYTMHVFPDWCFATRTEALILVRTQMEKAFEWQGSREQVIRKMDWVLFMKTWLRREGEKVALGKPQPPAQGGLFDPPSRVLSLGSKRDAERGETFKLMQRQKSQSGRRSSSGT